MADQDFQINIRTVADTTGVRQVGEQLDKIKQRQADAEAKWAKSPLNPKNRPSPPTPPSGSATELKEFAGTAVGIGTIVSLLTAAIGKWREFIDEEERILEKMSAATAKSHELGLSIVSTLDDLKSMERVNTEPLEQSFDRLTRSVRVLKAEMKIAFETGAYEDFNKLAQRLSFTEGLLNRVTTAQRAAGRAAADFARDASAARATDPQAGMTAVQKNAARLKQIEQLGKRKDLTQAEQKALRDAYIQTEKGYFDAEKEDAGRAAELMRQRQQGPGPGTLRTLDYFTKGPGAPTNMQTQGDKLDEILNYMKTVWGY